MGAAGLPTQRKIPVMRRGLLGELRALLKGLRELDFATLSALIQEFKNSQLEIHKSQARIEQGLRLIAEFN